jgi:hypothetical protein
MTGSITNAEEDGFVLAAGFFERFFTPGIPVYRVVGMLKEIGRGFATESVRHKVPVKSKDFRERSLIVT